jgi:putative membrane protein
MISKRMKQNGLLFAAAVLWTGAAAIGQQPGGSAGTMQGAQSQQQQQVPGQAGTPGNATTGMPGTDNMNPQAAGDQMFVKDMLQGDEAQVQMSNLAQQKSPSDDVKQFGQKMVQIHTQLSDQLEPVAKQLGVSEPKNPSKKQRQEIERLQALSGPDFDTAYLQAMARQQQHDLKEFKDEASSSQNPNLQKAAQADEPVLEQHYQILEKLAQAHNVTLLSEK